MQTNNFPVAIIGAGPIGLAAAAHLLKRGGTPLVFEAGPSVGAAVLQWGHVRISALYETSDGTVIAGEEQRLGPVDEIIATTGFRPDLSLLRELRLALDASLESPVRLAPLIDPNVHSCGTVPPHGVEELSHPEANFYIVGMKSYGRAPTFLTLTGYEQVRSIAAALTGDYEAAHRVELVLPETGVWSSDAGGSCAAPSTRGVAGQEDPGVASASYCTPSTRQLLTVGTVQTQAEHCCG